MKRAILYFITLAIIFLAYAGTVSQTPHPAGRMPEDTLATDTLPTAEETRETADTLPADSVAADSIMTTRPRASADTTRSLLTRISHAKADLDGAVTFSARDSLLLLGQNSAYLFGDGNVGYQQFKLNSEEIRMELDSSIVYANGVLDSVGDLVGNPIFQEKGTSYESKTMSYNFKTERGYITDVVTEQGEGYLTGGQAKKMEDGSFYVADGKYTTCDDHEHPHFYFMLTKARVRPNKDVVTGPGYMVLADVPLPLALPFGYFPFSKDYSSGILFPSFGDDYNRGFYLRDGGYYFAINDYVDLALRGEIYTKGSWGISGHSSYRKRYKFSGNFDFSYITTITGDKGSPDYQKQNNFQIIWSHTQDSKANPNMNFSASVNFATSGYSRNDLNSYYNNSFTENTKSSTVNLTYRFPGSKWSISATANIAQRTQDSTLAVSFPNINITMSQTTPFKRKKAVGGERWYEKIRLSYSGQFQNSLTAQQDQFFKKSLIKDWRNGMKHSVPISATFSLFKYINVTPSIQINDRMYTSKIRRQWNPNASAEIQDTTYGFYNIFDFNASVSMDTKIYGFWRPMKFLGDKIQMVRHVLTPSITFSGSPDFSAPGWGYYGNYSYMTPQGEMKRVDYSYFQHGYFGSPGRGTSSVLSVNLANNLEMKVKSDSDSTGYKKISLIENFTIGQSYNFAADSLRWSNINTSIMLRLVKNFNLNLNATWDPYMYALSPSGTPVKIDKLRISNGKGLPKLASTGTSFSYTFNNDTFKRKKKEEPANDSDSDRTSGDGPDGEFPDGDYGGDGREGFAQDVQRRRGKKKNDNDGNSDADGYTKWECPWSLTVNYSVSYGYGEFNYEKLDYKGRFNQNLSFSGSIRPTKNWNFSFSASYDFNAHKIAYMNCSISRDLHCFSMTASFVPVGPYKSYNFHIAVKSSMLKDLKYDKRSSTRNGIKWY